MRAGTILILFGALVVGLGATAAARSAGLFRKPEAAVADPAKPPEVVVASRNLFAGNAVDTAGVKTRPLRPEEAAAFRADPGQYLTAAAAAVLRVLNSNVEADRPVRRSDLQPLAKPEAVAARLSPHMRAVAVAVPKGRSAGGLIQVGEWVDVLFTTVCTAPGQTPTTRTATLADAARVIVKRDNLNALPAAQPDGAPVRFTLEVDPARAALIEYARGKGALTLAPRPAADREALEARRAAAAESADDPADDPAVGDADLMRLLRLDPPAPVPTLEVLSGASRQTLAFVGGRAVPVADGAAAEGTGYTFSPPGAEPADRPGPNKAKG